MKEQPKSREYRKKPITIEAVQFNNLNREEIELFIGQPLKQEIESETAYVAGIAPPISCLIIPRLEGEMKALPGDYIIKGVKGEFYPCKPDIFALTYERVSCEPPKPEREAIRKKAITVLELTKGFTSEQRANASNEFNTMEELAGDILILTAEKLSGEAKTPDRKLTDICKICAFEWGDHKIGEELCPTFEDGVFKKTKFSGGKKDDGLTFEGYFALIGADPHNAVARTIWDTLKAHGLIIRKKDLTGGSVPTPDADWIEYYKNRAEKAESILLKANDIHFRNDPPPASPWRIESDKGGEFITNGHMWLRGFDKICEHLNSRSVPTPDIYAGELNTERIAAYKKLSSQYNLSDVTIGNIFCSGADWALKIPRGTVPTPSDELLDNCWRSACEFSLAAIRGGDFDSKKAFKEWLRSSTEQGVGNSGNKG